ncbi:MAG: tetratricopeptide repeat protein [Planctomycetes bacterium]|nr:tetratricopeptide repeat protein [Planctomycetota bacterium]
MKHAALLVLMGFIVAVIIDAPSGVFAQEDQKKADKSQEKDKGQEEEKDEEEEEDQPQIPRELAERPDAELSRLARRCGRDIDWRKRNDLDAAIDEAHDTGRLIFAYVYDRSRSNRFGNKFKDNFMMSGPFVDTDLIAFINRKFIPARFYMNLDFAEALNLKLVDVIVPGILFISPDKKVVHKYDSITSASTELIYHVCRSVLQKNPEYNKPGETLLEREKAVKENPAHLRGRYLYGLELLREARWEDALRVFGDLAKEAPESRETVEGMYRSAWIYRLMRRPDEAFAAIEKAQKANAKVGVKIEGDLLLEKALVLLGQSKRDEARAIIEDLIKRHPRGVRTPEAKYFLGAIHWAADREKDAMDTWKEMAKEHSENPWAKKAAAEAIEQGPLVNGWESYQWLDADMLAGDSGGTERPRTPEEYPQVVADAVTYMHRTQRVDGSWRNVKGQFEFRYCITIIAHMALMEWTDVHPEGTQAALKRARKYIDAWSDRKTGGQGMSLWDHMYALFLYSRLAMRAADEGMKKDCLKHAKRAMGTILKNQGKDGTWTYGGGPSSFTTGGALVALWEAKQAGLKVDEERMGRAADALKTMKNAESDTYYYSVGPSGVFDDGDVKGSAGRMAVCYLAEYLWGKCDLAKLQWSLEKFFEYRIHLKRVRKSTDWHAGKYANASYFFFYDYWFASMGVKKMPDEIQRKWRTELRNDLLEINEIDGSWVDTHLFGKPYGTAMALMILKDSGPPDAK